MRPQAKEEKRKTEGGCGTCEARASGQAGSYMTLQESERRGRRKEEENENTRRMRHGRMRRKAGCRKEGRKEGAGECAAAVV